MNPLLPGVLCAALIPVARATTQDLIAVSWSGSVSTIDSFTGVVTRIGPGAFGQNAIGNANGSLFSQTRTGPSSAWVYDVTVIDPTTGQATVVFPMSRDVRGMATDRSGIVYAVLDHPGSDELALFDPTSGVFVVIGALGFNGVQALGWHQGALFATDVIAGILQVDTATGLATDIAPNAGVPITGAQFLASRLDGKLLCGGQDLFEVDLATGQTTMLFTLNDDIRGAASYFGTTFDFGAGCAGVSHAANGPIVAGGSLVSTSTGHAPGANGVLLIGIDSAPAPISLDPLFGTVGCSLLVQPQLNAALSPSGTADLSIALALGSNNGGFVLELQHAAIEMAPGGLTLSNATRVFVGF